MSTTTSPPHQAILRVIIWLLLESVALGIIVAALLLAAFQTPTDAASIDQLPILLGRWVSFGLCLWAVAVGGVLFFHAITRSHRGYLRRSSAVGWAIFVAVAVSDIILLTTRNIDVPLALLGLLLATILGLAGGFHYRHPVAAPKPKHQGVTADRY